MLCSIGHTFVHCMSLPVSVVICLRVWFVYAAVCVYVIHLSTIILFMSIKCKIYECFCCYCVYYFRFFSSSRVVVAVHHKHTYKQTSRHTKISHRRSYGIFSASKHNRHSLYKMLVCINQRHTVRGGGGGGNSYGCF